MPDAEGKKKSGSALGTPKPTSRRRAELTEELTERICASVRAGNYLETAARMHGVRRDQLQAWLSIGLRESVLEDSPYSRFRDAVLEAQAFAESRAVAAIETAANPPQTAILLKDENGNQLFDKDGLPAYIKPQAPNWQAAAFRLERQFARRWSKMEKHEVSGPNQGPQVIVTLPSDGSEALQPAKDVTASIDSVDEPLQLPTGEPDQGPVEE